MKIPDVYLFPVIKCRLVDRSSLRVLNLPNIQLINNYKLRFAWGDNLMADSEYFQSRSGDFPGFF